MSEFQCNSMNTVHAILQCVLLIGTDLHVHCMRALFGSGETEGLQVVLFILR